MTANIQFDPIRPHSLALMPPSFDYKSARFTELLIKARVELAELKGFSSDINQRLLLSPAILKESIASTGVENINTTMMNVLENQLFPESDQRKADKEVLHYVSAIDEGFGDLEKYALTTRTIKDIHKMLLTNHPGEYRKTEVKIEDTKTKERIYTPPVSGKVNELIGNLESFMNTDGDIDPLIKAAIIHYQFEAIHPFVDGNGRTGRILIVLFLVKKGLLHYPTLFISGYILKNKPEYYHVLLEVTKSGDWENYINFMLQGFYLQAKETKDLLFDIKREYFRFKKLLKENYKSIYSSDLVDALSSFPIITASRLSKKLSCFWGTASSYLKTLEKAGLFTSRKVGKYHFYMYKDLLKILYR